MVRVLASSVLGSSCIQDQWRRLLQGSLCSALLPRASDVAFRVNGGDDVPASLLLRRSISTSFDLMASNILNGRDDFPAASLLGRSLSTRAFDSTSGILNGRDDFPAASLLSRSLSTRAFDSTSGILNGRDDFEFPIGEVLFECVPDISTIGLDLEGGHGCGIRYSDLVGKSYVGCFDAGKDNANGFATAGVIIYRFEWDGESLPIINKSWWISERLDPRCDSMHAEAIASGLFARFCLWNDFFPILGLNDQLQIINALAGDFVFKRQPTIQKHLNQTIMLLEEGGRKGDATFRYVRSNSNPADSVAGRELNLMRRGR